MTRKQRDEHNYYYECNYCHTIIGNNTQINVSNDETETKETEIDTPQNVSNEIKQDTENDIDTE